MAFKINVSSKGKTLKLESENENLIGKKIGESIDGSDISEDLKGYTVEITGTSDISGIPGKKGVEGSAYHRELLTLGFGMKDRRKGMRLKKTLSGEEISAKTIQINSIVKKEGSKKFEELTKKVEKPAE
jgi:ribosomal protein S6E (S10)